MYFTTDTFERNFEKQDSEIPFNYCIHQSEKLIREETRQICLIKSL